MTCLSDRAPSNLAFHACLPKHSLIKWSKVVRWVKRRVGSREGAASIPLLSPIPREMREMRAHIINRVRAISFWIQMLETIGYQWHFMDRPIPPGALRETDEAEVTIKNR